MMTKRDMPKTITKTKKEKDKKEKLSLPLLAEFSVNSHFQIGIYKGAISDHDIIIKYKQLLGEKWSQVRTPKHIHWTVDILIKQCEEPEETEKFLDFLLGYWNKIEPLDSDMKRKKFLNKKTLLNQVEKEAENYPKLADKGEYSVKFLILLAKLLMAQEKTTCKEKRKKDAYMFGEILKQLKSHSNIFSLISLATHR